MAIVSCGKKGPPLAPLLIVPAAVSEVSANRFGDRVVVRFTPPEKNTDNSTPADLERIDVYALSAQSASAAPEAGVVVREGTRVGSIEMAKAAPGVEDQPASGPRTFSETLTAQALKTWTPPKSPAAAPTAVPKPAADATETTAAAEPQPVRLYALVPVSSRGRRGPAMLATMPLVPAPSAVAEPAVTYTDQAIALTWAPVEGVAGYNVYEVGSPGATGSSAPVGPPLNANPIADPKFEDKRVEFGKTRCYGVTAVQIVEQRRIESVLSAPACVTPADTFAPPAPTGVAAVAGPGSMSLIWDAVNASDLAGYVVLRGEAPGGTLQALTPEPIKETTFRDATVTPGTRYVYAVVAVDTAKNASAQSARVEEVAR